MSMHSQCEELREAARQFEGYQNGEISRMLREAAYTIISLRDRLQEVQDEDSGCPCDDYDEREWLGGDA